MIIDDLIKKTKSFTVKIDGVDFRVHKVEKPEFVSKTTKEEREQMAQLVLDGKAVAVMFFEDLTPDQQQKHMKDNM